MTTHITTLITIHSLSHSQIETWEQCPRRWYLEKIARVPRAPAEALVFGTAIHAAIEADGRRIAAGKDPLPLAHLLVAFAEALEAELAKADPWHFLAEQLPDLRLRGLAVLRAYEQSVQPHYHPLEVETDFELPIPSLDGWVFTGRLDALTGRDGVRTIVDFKTGGKPWPAGAEHSKDQATAYVWSDIVNFIQMPNDEATGHLEHVRRRVTFITLPAWRGLDGENYVCAPEFRTTTRGPVQIAHYVVKVHETAAAMTAAMEHGTFPAQTGPLCGWCSCLGSCEIGQTWLRERGRTPAVPVITPDMATVERAPAMDQRWTSDGPAMDQRWTSSGGEGMSATAFPAVEHAMHERDDEDEDRDLYRDQVVPDMPLKPGSPLSDPYAQTSTAAKVFVLGKLERETLRQQWDGTRETAAAIGEELGGIPTWKICAWARELRIPNTRQPHRTRSEGSTLTSADITALRQQYDIVPAEHVETAQPETHNEASTDEKATVRRAYGCLPAADAAEAIMGDGKPEPAAAVESVRARAEADARVAPPAGHQRKRGRGVRIPEETKARVVALREQGLSQKAVARQLTLSESTVYNIYANHQAMQALRRESSPAVASVPAPAPASEHETAPTAPTAPAARQIETLALVTMDECAASAPLPAPLGTSMAGEVTGLEREPMRESAPDARLAVAASLRAPDEANYAVLLDLLEFLPSDGRWASANQRSRWERAFLACVAVVTSDDNGEEGAR